MKVAAERRGMATGRYRLTAVALQSAFDTLTTRLHPLISKA
jgi:hypothetical protein